METKRATLTVIVSLTLILGAVSIAGAQMDGMTGDDDGMDNGMNDSMDDEMDGMENQTDGMDDGMAGNGTDDMDGGMDDRAMDGSDDMDDSMDGEMDGTNDDMDEGTDEEDGEEMNDGGGEGLPGFGVIAAGTAVLLSAVGMYVRRGD
ncbi:MAG: hypothetical protein U5J64_07235 [Halobacteriales archaeon]|nr:hypothetical protein [Halobacteriales archaeon]